MGRKGGDELEDTELHHVALEPVKQDKGRGGSLAQPLIGRLVSSS